MTPACQENHSRFQKLGFPATRRRCNHMVPMGLLRLSFFPSGSDPVAEKPTLQNQEKHPLSPNPLRAPLPEGESEALMARRGLE